MKLTTKEIVFLACVFVVGCFCAFYANTSIKHDTPAEFLNEKPMEPPKVEFEQEPSGVSYNDPELKIVEVMYTSEQEGIHTVKVASCRGCHWKCCQ
jgi:hypothetical protein